jgi:hypothetical protein
MKAAREAGVGVAKEAKDGVARRDGLCL